jgi:hypothetical protein
LSRISLEDRADALAVCRNDATRAVCRAIVDDDYLQRLIGLFKSTVDGRGDIFLIVAIDDYNRRQRAPSVHGVRTHWYHPRYTIWYLADHASTVRVPFLRLFNLAERHTLLCDDKPVQSFPPQLTDRQRQTLDQLGIPERAFLA